MCSSDPGTMKVKKEEFRSLRQGGRSLKEYMDDFYSLSRYAPEDVDTDDKRKEKFLDGLKGELKIPLSVAYAPNYQSLLDQAITLDNNMMKEENRKRKFSASKVHSESSHKRHHFSEGNGSHVFHRNGNHHHGENGHNHHDHNNNGDRKGNNGQHNTNGNGNGQYHHQDKRDLSHIQCYKCKKMGHYISDCPDWKAEQAAKPNPFKKGHVNHVNVEEVYDMSSAGKGKLLSPEMLKVFVVFLVMLVSIEGLLKTSLKYQSLSLIFFKRMYLLYLMKIVKKLSKS